MSILLKPDLEQRIAAKVQSGQYQSADEVVQQGLELLEARDTASQAIAGEKRPPIWETIVRLGEKIPEEELANIPTDLARNFDHYLYGSSKETE